MTSRKPQQNILSTAGLSAQSRQHKRWLPRWLTLWLPLGMLAAYLLGMILIPKPSPFLVSVIMSELGVIELGTAALYLAASIMAARLAIRAGEAPKVYRAMYVLVAVGTLFICLEEINYGQYFFEFSTPEWFNKHSTKGEFNFHNLAGNMPARRMNLVATVGFMAWCLVLPLIGRWQKHGKWWSRGHWSYFLIPGLELAVIVVIAQAMSWVDDVFGLMGWQLTAWARATEFKELYWGLAAFCIMLLLFRRLLKDEKTEASGR